MKRISISIPGYPINTKELIDQIELARKSSKIYTLAEVKKISQL